MILVALAAIALVGMAGLAVDGGRAYVDRRALQSAADSAADAGMRMLLLDFHASQNSPPSQPYSDAQINAAVSSSVNGAHSPATGLSSYTAFYIDSVGTHIGAVGSGFPASLCTAVGQSGCLAGVEVLPNYTHNTYLLGALGVPNSTEAARSASVFTLQCATGQTCTNGGLAPFVLWDQDCRPAPHPPDNSAPDPTTDTDPLMANDVVTFTDNHWSQPGSFPTNCGDGKNTASSSFRGWIDTCTFKQGCTFTTETLSASCDGTGTFNPNKTTINLNDCLNGGAGNDTGQEVCAASRTTSIFPMIDSINGSGTSYDFHVSGFAIGTVQTANAGCSGGNHTATALIQAICLPGSDSTNCILPPGFIVITSGFLH
jgi:Putative Flp pilus-assembly TadE/G-like